MWSHTRPANWQLSRPEMTLWEKVLHISLPLVALIIALAVVGFMMLHSAAEGDSARWAIPQGKRFAVGMALMLLVAVVDVRFWLRWAYLGYGVVLALLVAVEVGGFIGMGAQRWIDLGPFNLQPSELMKISLVVVLARYYHTLPPEDVGRLSTLILPVLLVAVPVGLVLRQPDLGTALILCMVSAALVFAAGVRLWVFVATGLLALAAIPVAWQFLHDYQKRRVLTFLDPATDPLGAGYHILQSKIALGSGGLFGKGFMQGTQSHLDFLPEKQTDFIFTMLAEEFGMVGGLGLLGLYILVLGYGFGIALRCRHHFGRLVAVGLTSNLFLYVFINMAMVMGLIPVVGVPLPLISYGGTVLLTLMLGFGLLMNILVHKDVQVGRRGLADD